jgi:HlyD family secretion protein
VGRIAGFTVLAVVLVTAVVLARGITGKKKETMPIPTAVVEKQDIDVTVEANGTVEPISIVDVKSKASGQIIQMPVEIGSTVEPGDLLAQIDTRDVQNQYDQVSSALQAARARADISKAQKARADDLFSEQIITAQEHEAAVLDHANSQAQYVKARIDVDLARQRLDDATVTAPVAGTVIDKPVSVGQVISSATSSVSGGTTLLLMADLKKIRVRALVNETDIGNVKPGQTATVIVDAYPQREFQGTVEKVEPRALVEQSVTMFPVLVSLGNEEGLLMPGMNGEVTLLVERREDVLAVPIDAVRNVRELPTAAAALGADVESFRAQLQAQMQQGGGAAGGQGRMGAGGDTSRVGGAGRDSMRTGGAGRDSMRAARRAGGSGTGRGNWSGGGAGQGGRTGGGMVTGGTGTGGGSRRGGGGGQGRVVVVKTAEGYAPRYIRVGLSNYDYAQIVTGLNEGEEVVLLSAAELQRSREENIDRMRQRMGSTMPGVGGGTNTGSGRGGAAGGAGRGGS